MLQAQINALEEEKASTSSQSMTSDSTDSTSTEDTTLMLESVHTTICERMFSDRMLQLERMHEDTAHKVQFMFEQLLKQGSTAASEPATDTSSEPSTVENDLVVLPEPSNTPKKRQKRNDQPPPATTQIDPNTNQWRQTTMKNVRF
jgi:hypothetical protein